MNEITHAITQQRQRPLSVGPLRAFEAVARRLSFRAAAEELHLTQSAISRQIRQTRGRRVVNVTTFASFASLWLIPRLEAFQREHADIDIRVSAYDSVVELDDSEIDLALRYARPAGMPAESQRLFGETLTPVVSPWLAAQATPLRTAADLAGHTLAEEDDQRPSAEYLSWRRWLREHGAPGLQPRRWMYLNFTYQQIQAALAGQAVALARVALVSEQLQRGDLVEPFGPAGRMASPFAYWLLLSSHSRARPEVQQFSDWVLSQAAQSRVDIGELEG